MVNCAHGTRMTARGGAAGMSAVGRSAPGGGGSARAGPRGTPMGTQRATNAGYFLLSSFSFTIRGTH